MTNNTDLTIIAEAHTSVRECDGIVGSGKYSTMWFKLPEGMGMLPYPMDGYWLSRQDECRELSKEEWDPRGKINCLVVDLQGPDGSWGYVYKIISRTNEGRIDQVVKLGKLSGGAFAREGHGLPVAWRSLGYKY